MNRDTFLSDIKKVLKKHNVWLSGTLKIRTVGEEWDAATASAHIADIYEFPPYRDTSGPFIHLEIEHKQLESQYVKNAVKTVIYDKDKLLAEGVPSPITKESFHNRREWNNHLKQHGCVEIGNDFNNAKMREEVRGDFDCRKELAQATHQIMEKYGN